MVQVVACHWGNWCGDWGPHYVKNLVESLKRHTLVPYNFTLLSDNPKAFGDIEDVRLLESPTWKGCLPKIQAFNPKYGFTGQVVLFDLDTLIVDNIDWLLEYQTDFCARAVYRDLARGHWTLDGDTLTFKAGVWTERIWEYLENNTDQVVAATGGRERFYYRQRFKANEVEMWQRVFPGYFLSYKNHCRLGLPDGGKVISFHGNPRIHECFHLNWVRSNWHG